jgi:hypothetical protein
LLWWFWQSRLEASGERSAVHPASQMITGTVHQFAVVPAAPPNYWQYDASGRLYAIPGYITSIDYEADGQTRKITYAHG